MLALAVIAEQNVGVGVALVVMGTGKVTAGLSIAVGAAGVRVVMDIVVEAVNTEVLDVKGCVGVTSAVEERRVVKGVEVSGVGKIVVVGAAVWAVDAAIVGAEDTRMEVVRGDVTVVGREVVGCKMVVGTAVLAAAVGGWGVVPKGKYVTEVLGENMTRGAEP